MRSDSCRLDHVGQRGARARRASSAPVSRSASGMLYGRRAVLQLVEEPQPLLGVATAARAPGAVGGDQRGRGAAPVAAPSALGQAGDGRRLEQVADAELDAERGPDRG